jgi:hypothetical protein
MGMLVPGFTKESKGRPWGRLNRQQVPLFTALLAPGTNEGRVIGPAGGGGGGGAAAVYRRGCTEQRHSFTGVGSALVFWMVMYLPFKKPTPVQVMVTEDVFADGLPPRLPAAGLHCLLRARLESDWGSVSPTLTTMSSR